MPLLQFASPPSWRVMLGVLSIPSLVYFALAIFYLPESPRWLVSKGRMLEAKQVLQRLWGREDVSGHLPNIFISLGRLLLESFVKKFILELKSCDIGAENTSDFIYNYAISMPNLARITFI
ncbi:monosaccharide-sensing protein 3-like isoform X2 [Camellia sinensis]|uniref:monosaccharide-sensing protein 3-like isoform X2 n=1 Tax=Camellia sinensis TaxID=4442 RepID=UPI001035AF07|nr:monosaccharide-sensing protein 3-like isoform X2 [Camellia sinensis]